MIKFLCALLFGLVILVSSEVRAGVFPDGKPITSTVNLEITYGNDEPYSRKHSQAEIHKAAEELRQYLKHDLVFKGDKTKVTESYDGDHWVIHVSSHLSKLSLQEALDANAALEIFVQTHAILGSSCWHAGKHIEQHGEPPTHHCAAR